MVSALIEACCLGERNGEYAEVHSVRIFYVFSLEHGLSLVMPSTSPFRAYFLYETTTTVGTLKSARNAFIRARALVGDTINFRILLFRAS